MVVNEKGNALFLILIAVALFAALSYAVTQSTRGGGNSEEETVSLEVAQLFNHVTAISAAVQRMRVLNCAEDEISFHADFWGHNRFLHTPEMRDECKVFHPDGGGLSELPIPSKWLDSNFSMQNAARWSLFQEQVRGVGTDGTGPGTDLNLGLCCLTKPMCMEINEQLGVPDINGDPPREVQDVHINIEFTGSYTENDVLEGPSPYDFVGVESACIEEQNEPGEYNFYHVLIPR